MPKVNPKILTWARETAGFSKEESVSKLALNDARGLSAVERLSKLERGTSDPSRTLLTKMAKLYRRPLLTFYMAQPPRLGDRGEDFRTLPKDVDLQENALVDALIRDIRSRQAIVRGVLEEDEDIKPLNFIGSIKIDAGVKQAVNVINDTIQFDLTLFRKQSSPRYAFEYLRNLTELAGIFVLLAGDLGSYHSDIDPEVFRGFALADNLAPFIVINDNDSKAAWSFTLLHEFVHLLLGQTGISSTLSDKFVEKFCNDIASEVLLPSTELYKLEVSKNMPLEIMKSKISNYANARNISATMVAYNLLKQERIIQAQWRFLRNAFKEDYENNRIRTREKARLTTGGPDYYVVRRQRIGEALINFVSRTLSDGEITTIKAGKVLGVKPQNVEHLIKPKHTDKPL